MIFIIDQKRRRWLLDTADGYKVQNDSAYLRTSTGEQCIAEGIEDGEAFLAWLDDKIHSMFLPDLPTYIDINEFFAQ